MKQYKDQITKLYSRANNTDQEFLYEQMKNGSSVAREMLINSCLPLVIKLAEKFHVNNKHIDIDDMIQEGNIALIKAIDRWDSTRGKLSTVATQFIKNALIDMVNDARYNVTTPYTMSRAAAEDFRKIKNVNSDDIEEISKQTKLKPKRVKKLLRNKISRVGMDFIDPPETSESTDKKCIVDLYELTENNLEGIDKRVFKMYIGVDGNRKTIRSICHTLNMTEQDVRSIIKKSKTKLKKVANA